MIFFPISPLLCLVCPTIEVGSCMGTVSGISVYYFGYYDDGEHGSF